MRNTYLAGALACAAAVVMLAQSPQTPAAGARQTQTNAPGTQNAPPPAGGAQNNRPGRRQAGAGEGYPNYDQTIVDQGQKIFSANCAFCHGANAKGGESGPNLLRSVTVLHDTNGDMIGPVVHNGRPDKGMPKFPLTDEQIQDIATFLHQRVKDAALRGTYQILNIVTGDAKQGETYFNAHCSSCHSVTGDLAHIAAKMEPVEIQQHIIMPRQGGYGPARQPVSKGQQITATVTMPSGESVHGALVHVDDFTIALRDGDGNYRAFDRNGDEPKVELKDPLQGHTDMLSKYTDADIHNLTAYLVTLK